MTERGLEIRSFRVVFDLERRIHRVDRWRLPLPYGLPLRSVAYAAAAIVAVLTLSNVPAIGAVLHALPTPARLVVLPAGVAYLLTRLNVDGRTAHAAGVAWIRHLLRGKSILLTGRAAAPATERLADVVLTRDHRSPRLQRGVVHGPATALVRSPVDVRRRGRRLVVRQGDDPLRDEWLRIAFDASRRLVIR